MNQVSSKRMTCDAKERSRLKFLSIIYSKSEAILVISIDPEHRG